MKRRDFVKNTSLGAIGVPFVLNGMEMNTVMKKLFSYSRNAEDRVLILIRLNGGNDGLNTVIPYDFYDNLVIQRPNIIIPQNQIVNLNTHYLGLHPAMSGMANMFGEGKLSIIQNVGYPDQNRSHFKSMDIWTSGNVISNSSTGWLGRYFDSYNPDFPTGYPNENYPDPFAISMGFEVSTTCQGIVSNYAQAVLDPTQHTDLGTNVSNPESSYYGTHLAFIQGVINQSNEYGVQIQDAANSGNSLSTLYDENNPLAVQLRSVAKMISGGLQTKVYILNVNGFDTHDAQVVVSDTSTGFHASLLKTLSDAVFAFQDDLALLGLENRVLGMTFSEFGRQIAANGSNGTDHGDAAPLFVFGTCIDSQVIGDNPVVLDQVVNQKGCDMQYDFRDVYASILHDWFMTPESEIQQMFEHQVNLFPIARACNGPASIAENLLEKTGTYCYPNPCREFTNLVFVSRDERVTITIIDMNGRVVERVLDKSLDSQEHQVRLDTEWYDAGNYFYVIDKPSGSLKGRFQKINI
jgi:uncharacterized protein (DUF1501 family)